MKRTISSRLGRSGAVAAAIGLLALVAALYVESTNRGGSEELAALIEARRAEPAELIAEGAGNRRIVVIGDVRGRAEPKRIAAGVLRRLAKAGGVDALVVDVDSAHQGTFDRYISGAAEDASLLLRADGLLEEGAEGRARLDLYRSVYALNDELGADRMIRIIAAGPGAWPPQDALSPAAAAERFAKRGEAMAELVERQILGSTSGTRVVALVDALQALKATHGQVVVGGGDALDVNWMASELADRYPIDVYTALPDGSLEGIGYPTLARYAGTTVNRRARSVASGSYAVPVVGELARMREPVRLEAGTGVMMRLAPEDYTLGDVADIYVQLGGG